MAVVSAPGHLLPSQNDFMKTQKQMDAEVGRIFGSFSKEQNLVSTDSEGIQVKQNILQDSGE